MKNRALQPAPPPNQPPSPPPHRRIRFPILGFVIVPLLIGALFVGRFSGFWMDRGAATPAASSNVTMLDSSGSSRPATSGEGDWSLILVNRWHPIPDHYKVSLTRLSNGQSVDTRIYAALQQLFAAARANGLYPVVASGYRTAQKQQSLMDQKISSFEEKGDSPAAAKTAAEAWVAIPGTSEHQLGLAVDINADGIHSTGNQVYQWLNKNSYKYGFIQRYPPDKAAITATQHEPWHYRYVGVTAATEIHQKGLCLEEYLAQKQAAS